MMMMMMMIMMMMMRAYKCKIFIHQSKHLKIGRQITKPISFLYFLLVKFSAERADKNIFKTDLVKNEI